MGESTTMVGRLYVGTSGFAYDEWKGPFYPEGLRDRDMLSFYASRFGSVEVNYTFRRDPSDETLARWRESTPAGFLITLKAHQRITHWLRLAEAHGAVSAFLDRARPLGDRLGVILFQCPPNLPYDRSLIEAFVAHLPPTVRSAFEFRHPSWIEAKELLASRGAAWCVAETDQRPFTDHRLEPWPFVYLRLRKEFYSEEELAGWAGRIEPVLAAASDVFCYFKHEDKAAGPTFAERLRALVDR